MKITWIGVGVMGTAMAQRLQQNNYEVVLYSRSSEKISYLEAHGFRIATSIAEAITGSDVIITMVGYPSDVEEVYFGETGIISNYHLSRQAICIDMTTSSPTLAKRIAQQLPTALDAPVSGGDIGAKAGSLSIMVGGAQTTFDLVLPLLQHLGKTITYLGEAGNGQHTKMANQIALAASLAGVAESIRYQVAANLPVESALALLAGGAAGSWQLSNNGMKMLIQDYTPGFYMKHFLKDLQIAKTSAFEMGIDLPVLNEVLLMVTYLVNHGYSDAATQAIYEYYRGE
ncbi:MAG: NAD(P)-dependent oxidoreductase [Erysipelotrichaceae bacterium]